MTFQVGEVVTIPADAVLGTLAFKAVVVEVESYGYLVEDVNNPDNSGPVDWELNILSCMC